MFVCGDTEVSPGVTLLRTVFEDGLRASLMQEPGLTTTRVDCILAGIRERVGQGELREIYRAGEFGNPILTKVRQASAGCRGAA